MRNWDGQDETGSDYCTADADLEDARRVGIHLGIPVETVSCCDFLLRRDADTKVKVCGWMQTCSSTVFANLHVFLGSACRWVDRVYLVLILMASPEIQLNVCACSHPCA